MPVVTAAVVAVSAAITTIASATATAGAIAASVATAAVSVSAAIGVAGLGVTAIGAITGNKDLLKAGKIMGYVGLAGGLVGGAIGGVGAMASGSGSFLEGASAAYSGAAQYTSDAFSSYADNIGRFFNPETANSVLAAKQEALGTGIVAGTNPQAGQTMITGSLDQEALGQGIRAGTSGAMAPANAGAMPASAVSAPSISGPDPFQVQSPVSTGPAAPAAANAPGAIQAPAPIAAPQAPGVVVNPDTGTFIPGIGQVAPGAAQTGAIKTGQGLFDSMPDWMKYSAMTTGAQGLTGLASGYYQGLSAEEQLNFQKLVNQQNQNQVQHLNQNNAYAPLVKFGPKPASTGLINRPGA